MSTGHLFLTHLLYKEYILFIKLHSPDLNLQKLVFTNGGYTGEIKYTDNDIDHSWYYCEGVYWGPGTVGPIYLTTKNNFVYNIYYYIKELFMKKITKLFFILACFLAVTSVISCSNSSDSISEAEAVSKIKGLWGDENHSLLVNGIGASSKFDGNEIEIQLKSYNEDLYTFTFDYNSEKYNFIWYENTKLIIFTDPNHPYRMTPSPIPIL